MTLSVALIGFGALAQTVCDRLAQDPDVSIRQVLVRPEKKQKVCDLVPPQVQVIDSTDALLPEVSFVVEVASHSAVSAICPAILRRGIDVGLVSVGALAQQHVLDDVTGAAKSGRARAEVLPGAIGGIDALSAARHGLHRVDYTSRKAPISWRGSPAEKSHDLDAIAEPTVLFTGTAREAAIAFPKNANVVATVALAGVGFDKTRVTLMADPGTKSNCHQVLATGEGIALDYTTCGQPLPTNPRTSALTADSIVRAITNRSGGLII